jgi:hypothetical protein
MTFVDAVAAASAFALDSPFDRNAAATLSDVLVVCRYEIRRWIPRRCSFDSKRMAYGEFKV